MISDPAFPAEPWLVRETSLDLGVLAQTESVFALSNGHIGLRGNLDEGDPHGLPGTYLNSLYEVRPMPYGEAGYGYPDSGQTVINVTNGKLIRLLVEDEPFDVRYGDLRSHERVLSLRDGTLRRTATWTSPSGHTVEISSTRLVSFTQRATVAISYEVRPLGRPLHVVLQSELVANEQLPSVSSDPRAAAVLEAPLKPELHGVSGSQAMLVHSTRVSGRRVGVSMDHVVDGPPDVWTGIRGGENLARYTVTAGLADGQPLRLVKFIAYGWSSQRTIPAITAQVEAALTLARATGWDGLLAEQREYLDDYWQRADVDVDGDDEVQQAVRFALFQLLQASARAERRPVAAKGLTGRGYDGHAFWDTESYVLPVLTYVAPDAAEDVLRWRFLTLPAALERARQLTLEGAAFPWRTITGEECSAYWPAGTAAFHVNADIADAAIRLAQATGNLDFEREVGLGLLVATARLWMSLGYHDPADGFRIDGVTGPDEYSAICDNNVYTNLMAQRNLVGAADAVARHPDQAAELGVDRAETDRWRAAAAAMLLVYDAHLGVHPQAERFTEHARWDFADTAADQYPLLLHFPYFDLYRKQVVKQADLVLALYKCGDAFTAEEKARDFAYYEELTVRDSSLSACVQAVVAAEVGQLDLAYDYLGEAARMDLDDLEHNTNDGLHIASLAGSWLALVAGFGGMRDTGTGLTFAPRLPTSLRRLGFHLLWRGERLRVEVLPGEATYSLAAGDPVELAHHGEAFTLVAGQPVVRAIPPVEPGPRPTQPPGRQPRRRAAR
ncbi:MAG: alpha,alpha-trehalose phosphorylase [Micromonosporaceae bacterium]|nr:alpha,alpha-trehalose phosphorylase [Micromonosporaceae bacterium]